MTKSWVIADPHFGHRGVCKFLRNDGTKLRPWNNPDDMDAALVDNWNSLVKDGDRVYLAGDVVINRRCLPILSKLKGRKCLVKGNHDIFKLKDYTPYFDDIRACVVGKGYIITHIPLHPACVERYGLNIHGHLHSNKIDDPKYLCVSVEHWDFKPVDMQYIIDTYVSKKEQ